ncbi:MAG: glycosyltransferase family 2 protein [Phycisphaerae bacterium]|jgi:GT2 family glycosyltransferase
MAVGILTFNRAEPLRRALDSVLEQGIEPLEVIVADNGSTDGTAEMLARDYPHVKLIRIEQNIGGPAGRNVIFQNCSSDYIINLDDDGYLAPDTIEKVREAFEADSEAGVIALRQCFTDEPDKGRSFAEAGEEAVHFYEGVCAFRMAMLEEVGLYPQDFFHHHEALDLGIRILDSRWKIISRPDIIMWHPRLGGGSNADRTRWDFLRFRNYLYVVTRYYPAPLNLYWFARKSLLYLCYSLKRRTLTSWCRAMMAVLAGLPKAARYKKVRAETVRRYYREMKRTERKHFS